MNLPIRKRFLEPLFVSCNESPTKVRSLLALVKDAQAQTVLDLGEQTKLSRSQFFIEMGPLPQVR